MRVPQPSPTAGHQELPASPLDSGQTIRKQCSDRPASVCDVSILVQPPEPSMIANAIPREDRFHHGHAQSRSICVREHLISGVGAVENCGPSARK